MNVNILIEKKKDEHLIFQLERKDILVHDIVKCTTRYTNLELDLTKLEAQYKISVTHNIGHKLIILVL